MTDDDWKALKPDEKLDWLRTVLEGLVNFTNGLSSKMGSLHESVEKVVAAAQTDPPTDTP